MVHLDWNDGNGESFYRKRVDLIPDDSSHVINSSISISPETRQAGNYLLKVYLFRELVAEKKFEILPKFKLSPDMIDAISTDIVLYRYKSKKSGKLIGEGAVFEIKEKANVRALITIENTYDLDGLELKFTLKWTDSIGNSFYSKEIYTPDTLKQIQSSISISPNKRQSGKYSLRVYLFDELIGEEQFLLTGH